MLRQIIIFSLLCIPILAHAQDNRIWEVTLPFEQATIEYSVSGVEEGEETLYIKNYGNITARYHRSSMHVMGIEKISETISFMDPEWIYIYDLQERTGTKSTNPQKYLNDEFSKLSPLEKQQVQRNSRELGKGFLYSGMSGEFEEYATTILGMRCDKIKIMDLTMYTIHDSEVPLKKESDIMGMVTLTEATTIKEGFAPESYFQHPQGINVVLDLEADSAARSMAQETMSMLKDPQASEKVHLPDSTLQLQPDPEEQQDMEKAIEALKNIFEN